jgi:hypothetical protein
LRDVLGIAELLRIVGDTGVLSMKLDISSKIK